MFLQRPTVKHANQCETSCDNWDQAKNRFNSPVYSSNEFLASKSYFYNFNPFYSLFLLRELFLKKAQVSIYLYNKEIS